MDLPLCGRFESNAISIDAVDVNSAQAYDDDRFYFVHDGQVYEPKIAHAGKENWTVHDVFLNSFHFSAHV